MNKQNSLITVFCILGFCSCKKNQSTVANPKVDVYVAGQANGSAAYWKNDSLRYLTNGTEANSIVVLGNDVYVAGSGGGKAKYWKNGVESPVLKRFENFATGAYSIAVSGNDVYVAGWGLIFSFTSAAYPVGCFWKNDSLIDPSSLYAYTDYLTSITISGNDIYVVGVNDEGDAIYYKNGNPVVLSAGDANMYNYVSSISVSGNNVYVAGSSETGNFSVAEYWKNASLAKLTSGSTNACATSIAVSGINVYVAGYEDSVAKYWKNNIAITLSNYPSSTNSIAVSGTDVYVAGTANGLATYWKNGIAVTLSNIPSSANSIFLSKQ